MFNLSSLETLFSIEVGYKGRESTFDALHLKEDVKVGARPYKEGPCRLSYLTSEQLRNKFKEQCVKFGWTTTHVGAL
jgi:hypothetical protein